MYIDNTSNQKLLVLADLITEELEGLQASEADELIKELDKRAKKVMGGRDSSINCGMKSLIMFSRLYTHPEVLKDAYHAVKTCYEKI